MCVYTWDREIELFVHVFFHFYSLHLEVPTWIWDNPKTSNVRGTSGFDEFGEYGGQGIGLRIGMEGGILRGNFVGQKWQKKHSELEIWINSPWRIRCPEGVELELKCVMIFDAIQKTSDRSTVRLMFSFPLWRNGWLLVEVWGSSHWNVGVYIYWVSTRGSAWNVDAYWINLSQMVPLGRSAICLFIIATRLIWATFSRKPRVK